MRPVCLRCLRGCSEGSDTTELLQPLCSTKGSLGSSRKPSRTTQYSPLSGRRKSWVYYFGHLDENLGDRSSAAAAWQTLALQNPGPGQPAPAAQAHEACGANASQHPRRPGSAGTARHREPTAQLLNHLLKPLGFKRALGPAQALGQKAAQGREPLDILPLTRCPCGSRDTRSSVSPVGHHLLSLTGWYHSPGLDVCSGLRHSAPSMTPSKEGLATAYSSLL